MNIWHPTQTVEVCLNRTWNYSSPAAEKLGLINNLELLDTCLYFHIIPVERCLKLSKVKPYYEFAYFTCTVESSDYNVEQKFVEYEVKCKCFKY